MQLRYNYRVYPDAAQRSALAQVFGCARVVRNDCLRVRKDAHAAGMPYVSSAELSKRLQQSLRDLDAAFRNFFESLKGSRKGRKYGPPRFKSKKDSRQCVRLNTNAFALRDDGRVYVAKVGDLRVRWSRPLPAPPTSLTVVKDAAGRYFASFVVDTQPDVLPERDSEVGIDLGLTTFAVLSDGTKISSPRFLRRAEKKLKHGRHFGKIDRFEPTSQVCSLCGRRDGPKPLQVREWTCPGCGTVHDRDENAAINTLAAGRADRRNASWSAGKTRTKAPAQRDEAGSRSRQGEAARQGFQDWTVTALNCGP
ncbi:RNA-guided endonuclease TnpB family protein [Streptomyces sp. NBC_00091]|uniref:RNA-guided endonuclease InsQ/TnpB family protein n=1 Tax=Streptomyces sp. NBC_00091 TaxID=2975648 RepID=UPI00224EE1E1|nr:RNA-guided endonuclease TnpB family protein [Streptomyces sp. NBC_00091]MCX5378360.1 transposase [Streptomyces sp. NBC_00091]